MAIAASVTGAGRQWYDHHIEGGEPYRYRLSSARTVFSCGTGFAGRLRETRRK